MFYIKYILEKSKLHGIGLFANENISKGQKIYKENPNLNLFLSSEKFLKLPLDERKTIQHYGYFDKKNK